MALKGYLTDVKVQSSAAVFTGEATTTSDNTIYTITNTSKTVFDFDTDLVVLDGGTATTESYTVSKLTGTVTFESVDAGRAITLTGAYVLLTSVAQAKSISLALSADALDATPFQKDFREYEAGKITGTVDLGKFAEVSTYFLDMLLDGDIKVIEYYPNSGLDAISFYAIANNRNVDIPQDGLIDETVSFNITNEIGV